MRFRIDVLAVKTNTANSPSTVNMFDLNTCIRKNILELQPYRCARDDFSEGILLDANECAYGSAYIADGTHYNRYPDPRQIAVKERFCAIRNGECHPKKPITHENIVMGVGSDEIIDSLIRITCIPGKDTILMCPPSYGMYPVCAKVNDVKVKKVLLKPDFTLDTEAVLKAIREDPTIKVVFVCSPGNPTAKNIALDDIKRILDEPSYNGLVVSDEAYIDFSPAEASAVTIVNEYPNLAVCQTLSKAFGLAGIRVGFCITDPKIAQIMNNLKAPYNISNPTSKLAYEALSPESAARKDRNRDALNKQRDRLVQELPKIPGVGSIIGGLDANFLLVTILDKPAKDGKPSNESAHYVYMQMATEHKVVVRYRGSEPLCEGGLRITVGTEEENTVLLDRIAFVLNDYFTKKGITSA
ncbi:histidinol-phosphate aminotransferase imidazole acetol phosphate transaminase His3 [Schizosaccharomyces japonicus yFS275]|uniref:histidinol-phosphate transaminase n=1 Tax=Schizosaccharomyces japonicus (strain yFS275 / FY16936) TaxID=402676 RepID=B6K373_SCHJY|nr:histidinol-phosphate aminotransferase imidazole acetol phosphate transaminase His3 [Schizosaccharomyces japonicus yFS275]EEB07930.2 histidinol-phosphate aminotransferase imidazole acetol phosphate transaminase His3 [Schizosaccharomyces japonicus yFS275]